MHNIPSFEKNHDLLQTGLHEGTTMHGVTTWDLRCKKPNAGDYISPKALHTVEHLLATTLRNSERADDIIYFGPMGCRTGFYLLTEGLTYREAYEALRAALAACADMGAVPGARRSECGNYLEHDLAGAKAECAAYLRLLGSLPAETLGAEREAMREAER